ncbi:Glycosyltransferase family 64 protein C4 [Striga hermonthica]|uniref:Glycosyltransferase family 64 protein C4 n=1 Tax=Striga hermonthica TaxID=68872 RepID=A0A9N7N5Q1_STRHE|nr:Glycosyltransferase family 64 protein C4 [Striga hermonthica]
MRTGLFNRRTIRQGVLSVGSAKIKLMLACCIVFTFIALAGRTATFLGWNYYSAPLQRSCLPGEGYTLLINTWKRNDLLKQSISHYAKCPGLDSVHIVWSEPDPPSKSLVNFLNRVIKMNSKNSGAIELKFDINKEDSLNNRFKEIKDLKSDVVFSIDDDIIFPCTTVEFAFSVWRSAPDTMVGMILSKAAFFHKKYLSMYSYEMPSSIREYVTKNRNCEDIAMSFLVANATGAPPIWVKGNIFEIGSTGISSMGGHTEKRTECVNRFVTEYGRMPLVLTPVKAIDSRVCWFW